ncbi:hypothetical protein F4777DRAFT_212259 [Nemania sp. FL0916]|nr:hypothetical protein F4777DRAFT_212259 [Nemania sp. FL0916]
MFTTLAFPDSCRSQTWVTSSKTGTTIGTGFFYGNPYTAGDCWPAGADAPNTTITPAICPSGYSSVKDETPKADPEETVWACCPINYSWDRGFFSCHYSVGAFIFAFATDGNGNTIRENIDADGVNAHSVRVAFHSSDFQSMSSSSTTSESGPSTSTPTSSLPAPSSNPDSQGGSPLPTGVGIGIGVTIGAFSVIILLGIGWILRRRSRTKTGLVELRDSPPPRHYATQRHDINVAVELSTFKEPRELSAIRDPRELHATPRQERP